MASSRLKNKVAIITAAGRNMGRAIALDLAREGASVVVNARSNEAEVREVVESARALGAQAEPFIGDVGQRDVVEALVAATVKRFGTVHVLVNVVGVRPAKPFLEITDEELQAILSVNLLSPWYASQAVLPYMVRQRYGRIINFSGVKVFSGGAGRAHVLMSKAGVLGLTRALAFEFGESGITVNTIVPGAFDTQRRMEWYPKENDPSWQNNQRAATIPAKRLGAPEEITGIVTLLASEAGAYINGQSIHVNGGEYAT